jgi:hypothetical protein
MSKSDQMAARTFAFGKDTAGTDDVETTKCPARQAGFAPSTGDESTQAAELFDDEVRTMDGVEGYEGVVDEAVAEEAWRRVLQKLKARSMDDSYWTESYEVAQQIADDLGWI